MSIWEPATNFVRFCFLVIGAYIALGVGLLLLRRFVAWLNGGGPR